MVQCMRKKWIYSYIFTIYLFYLFRNAGCQAHYIWIKKNNQLLNNWSVSQQAFLFIGSLNFVDLLDCTIVWNIIIKDGINNLKIKIDDVVKINSDCNSQLNYINIKINTLECNK